mgnify:CR=1 FL=1
MKNCGKKLCTSLDASHGFLYHFLTFQNGVQKRKEKIYDCDIKDMDFNGNYYMASSASGQCVVNSVF